jgi:hypothetical protein
MLHVLESAQPEVMSVEMGTESEKAEYNNEKCAVFSLF